MEIYFDKLSSFYDEALRKSNLCVTVSDNNEFYYYEFNVINRIAKVRTNDNKYIEEASSFFHDNNKYITKIYALDNSFYQEFDEVMVYKLPIKVILPTEFLISKERYEAIDNTLHDLDSIYLPVAIIDDEYVLLDGHIRLYIMQENLKKLVYVYLDEPEHYIKDLIYIGKEQNVKTIKDVELVSEKQYKAIWEPFIDQLKNNSF